MATVHRAMEQDPESEGRRLRHKRPAAAAAEDVAESAKMKKGPKSRKDISKDYRERVKENPELLKAHREAEKNGSRSTMEGDQRKRYNATESYRERGNGSTGRGVKCIKRVIQKHPRQGKHAKKTEKYGDKKSVCRDKT